MRKPASLLGFASMVALTIGLAGCGAREPETAAEAMARTDRAQACPTIAVPADTAELIQRRGAASNDVVARMRIADWAGECTYETQDGATEVTVDLNVVFAAQRGPAGTTDTVSAPFFIAVTDQSRAILDKQVFTTTIELDATLGSGQTIEPMRQVIPLTSPAAGASYRVYVGFQTGS